MTAWIILGSILGLGGVVAFLKWRWNKLVKENEFLESENQTLKENNLVLEEKNFQLNHAIKAYDDLEGSLGKLKREYDAKKKEYEKLIADGSNQSSSDAFNGL